MRDKDHHRREVFFLIGFLVVFFIIFIIAFLNLKRGMPVFGIGLSPVTEDLIILALSFLSIIKVLWNIIFY